MLKNEIRRAAWQPKKQVGGATYVCKHLAEKLKNCEPLIESEITTGEVPGEFAAICISCAEYIWASLPKG